MKTPSKIISAFGSFYVRARKEAPIKKKPRWEPPKLEDLIKIMQTQPVSPLYVRGLLEKLSRNLPGSELVETESEAFVSIANSLFEIVIAPLRGSNDEISVVVEKISSDGSCRQFGNILISAETTYNELVTKVKKILTRAVAST